MGRLIVFSEYSLLCTNVSAAFYIYEQVKLDLEVVLSSLDL